MAHVDHSPTTTKALASDLPLAFGAAVAATILAGLLIGALAVITTSPAPVSQEAAAPVTDGWMSYLGGSAVEADVVDGWSSYLTPGAATISDGWQSYLGAAAAPDVTDGWMSRYGQAGD